MVFFDLLEQVSDEDYVFSDGCTDEQLSRFLRGDLYGRGYHPNCRHLDIDVMPHFTNTVCCAYRILMVIKAVEARAMALGESSVSHPTSSASASASPSDAVSKHGCTADEVSLAEWRASSPAGMLAQLAWDVHRESNESYRQMIRSLLAGSSATSLPVPPADSRELLFRSFSLSQLEAAHFPQGISQDLVRKARQLCPFAFPKPETPSSNRPMLIFGTRHLMSCFSGRLRSFLRPYHVSDLQAALASTMHDLLGRDRDEEQKEYDSDMEYDYNGLL
jgi:hypothetical protein